jgi:hypothetical protein
MDVLNVVQNAEDNGLIARSSSIRPTRTRLLISMGVSACFIVFALALLGPLFDFAGKVSRFDSETGAHLIVHIRKDERKQHASVTAEIESVRSVIPEPVAPPDIAPDDSPEPPAVSRPVKDWHAIAGEAARASVNEYFEQEESRALMWQRTHSIMFKPENDKIVKEIEPVLSDIRFKRYSRVLGIGLNIGSCFIGIPIAGVPVEQRTAAISIFVCS